MAKQVKDDGSMLRREKPKRNIMNLCVEYTHDHFYLG